MRGSAAPPARISSAWPGLLILVASARGSEVAVRSLRKEPVPQELILKPLVIEKSNYQAFEVPVEQRVCPTLADMMKQ